MSFVGFILMIAGFIGVVIGFFRIVIYAFNEQGALWGLLCLFVPAATLIWGAVHWENTDARTLFVRYLGSCGALILGMFLNRIGS